jgi:hypothetical protein
MERIQILLKPVDRQSLKQLAGESHTSMSSVARHVAEKMAAVYRSIPGLTALSA